MTDIHLVAAVALNGVIGERLKAEIEADQAREKASMAAIAEESRNR